MEHRHEKAKAMIMRRASKMNERTTGAGTSKELSVDLEVTVAELHRNKRWRRQLRKKLEKTGIKVEAINILVNPEDGHHVVVVISPKVDEFQKRKPVTRGSKEINGPKKARTIKTVLRT